MEEFMIAEVGFRLAGGAQPLILVPASVNDEGAFDFVLDTGAGTTLLSTELAQRLRVEATGTREGQTAGGKTTVQLGSVGSLAIGKARVENIEVAILDLKDLGNAVGARIDGDVGYNFLKHFRLTIDYRKSRLRLAKGLYEVVGQAASKEVGFKLASAVKPLVLVEAIVNGAESYDFALDTGCSTTMISPEFAKRLKIEGVPIQPISTGGGHQISASLGHLASLTVGQSHVRNLPVVIADSFRMLNQATGADFNGIIGYNFLKEFALTIDYPSETIQFSK
jgi:predicted aspartyl protease